MTDPKLFTPYTLGALTLSNRVVLAPLTRNRAGHGFVPSEFVALRQRFKTPTSATTATTSTWRQRGGLHRLPDAG